MNITIIAVVLCVAITTLVLFFSYTTSNKRDSVEKVEVFEEDSLYSKDGEDMSQRLLYTQRTEYLKSIQTKIENLSIWLALQEKYEQSLISFRRVKTWGKRPSGFCFKKNEVIVGVKFINNDNDAEYIEEVISLPTQKAVILTDKDIEERCDLQK